MPGQMAMNARPRQDQKRDAPIRARSPRPGKPADRHQLLRLQRGDIDDRHVIDQAVGDTELLALGVELEMPGPLADQDILLHLIGGGVDHRHPVGRSQRHEGELPVFAEVDAHGLDQLSTLHTGNSVAGTLADRPLVLLPNVLGTHLPELCQDNAGSWQWWQWLAARSAAIRDGARA
jgi:hypothetical protein